MYLKPKKKLGQNFLTDKNIQRKICDTCALEPSDIVLEIGAGRGELTALLAARANRVYALEIDDRLCEILQENLKNTSNVEIINQDILKFDLKRCHLKSGKRLKVIGNIPYYISSPIIECLLNSRERIHTVFITVQKEFAERIAAKPGSKDYGSFSCFVQYYAQPLIILNIKKGCFTPRPKVDSALISLKIRPIPWVNPKDEKLFFRIIRSAFNKRRKTLRNSLEGIISAEKLEKFFLKYSLDKNTRPERLSLQDFANLTDT